MNMKTCQKKSERYYYKQDIKQTFKEYKSEQDGKSACCRTR